MINNTVQSNSIYAYRAVADEDVNTCYVVFKRYASF